MLFYINRGVFIWNASYFFQQFLLFCYSWIHVKNSRQTRAHHLSKTRMHKWLQIRNQLICLIILIPSHLVNSTRIEDIIAYSVKSDGDDQLYQINLSTGTATAIGATGFGDIEGLTFDHTGTILYGFDDITNQLVTINTSTGAATAVEYRLSAKPARESRKHAGENSAIQGLDRQRHPVHDPDEPDIKKL